MGRHRRPSRLSRRAPLYTGAVGTVVAGAVAVTGTLTSQSANAAAPTRSAAMTALALQQRGPTAIDERTQIVSAVARGEQLRHIRAVEARIRYVQAVQARKIRVTAAKKAAIARRLEQVQREREAARERASRAQSRTATNDTSGSAGSSGSTDTAPQASGTAAEILAFARAQFGKPYAYGADGPGSFDCSGFTQYVFAHFGISLPHSSGAQAGVARRISSSEKRPGDLVFVYNGGGGSIGHVAIYAGNGVWYESSRPGKPVGANAAWSTNVSYGRVL